VTDTRDSLHAGDPLETLNIKTYSFLMPSLHERAILLSRHDYNEVHMTNFTH